MTDDRIALTNRASPQNGLGTACGPIGFELVRDGKWDKENRSSWELCPGVDLPRSEPEAELLLLNRKPNWKRIQLLGYDLYTCDSKDWPVITDLPTTEGKWGKYDVLN